MDDLSATVAFLNRQAMVIHGEPDSSEQELREEWETPGLNLTKDVLLAEREGEGIIGYAEFFNTRGKHVRPSGYVSSSLEPFEPAVAAALVRWVEKRAHEDMPRAPAGARITLVGGISAGNERIRSAWSEAGFTEARRFYQMRITFDGRPAAPVVPEGLTIRPIRDDERRRTYEAVHQSFRDHFGYVEPADPETDYRRWAHYFFEPDDYDPDLLLIAVDEAGRVAGLSLCRATDGVREDTGYVGQLAVVREFRRRGLGEALLRRSFEVFYEKGRAAVSLGVDADSLTNATRLYEKCGMHQHRVFVQYQKVIRDGEELANLG
jgi:ribosomal protein S18 acetylase RimI-like enzyme